MRKEDSSPVITGRSYSNMKNNKTVKPPAPHWIHANLEAILKERDEVLQFLTSI